MAVSSFSRVNTLGVTCLKGAIQDIHVRKIIENICGVPENEVLGVDSRGINKFIFKVSTKEKYIQICDNVTDRDHILDEYHTFRVDDISSNGTCIEVSRIPFEMSDDIIKTIFSKFGKILKLQNFFRGMGGYSNLTHTGERLIWMELNCDIPHSIFIKQLNSHINARYEKQPFSCNKCGLSGHSARNCKTDKANYIRVVDLNEIKVDELDIHSEPMAKEVKFKCDECVFESAYEKSFLQHKALHKSNIHSCPNCEYQTSSELELINHMKAHTSEKPEACEERDKLPSSELDDNNHKQSHKESNLKCQKCDHQASTKVDLENHRLTHTDEKPDKTVSIDQVISNKQTQHKCNTCEQTFECVDALNKHSESHIDEILFKCSECAYECLTGDVLSNHLKTKHNVYTCKECDFKGKSQKALSKHVKTHASPGHSQSQKRDCPPSPDSIQLEDSNRNIKKSRYQT